MGCLRIATCHTPIIFLTGANDARSIERGLQCGAMHYICKPFDCDELRAQTLAALR